MMSEEEKEIRERSKKPTKGERREDEETGSSGPMGTDDSDTPDSGPMGTGSSDTNEEAASHDTAGEGND